MITCILRNHDFINEVQVTAQVFFPGEKFAFTNAISETGYTVVSDFEPGGAHGFVFENDVRLSHYFFKYDNNVSYLNERRVVMLALFHALRRVIPMHTPWGALTGIRPSKLVREWMDDGCGDNEIIERLTETFYVSDEKSQLALTVAHAEKSVESRITNTIGLYVSIPFCPSRCIYCSFNTSDKPTSADFLERYVSALIRECREKARENTADVSSIYIGGGTPTVLSENQLEKLLYAICDNFSLPPEFTVEAGRPDTLTTEKLKILRKYGVNRLAVNPQTLNDHTLKSIGRNHTAADFFTAFNHAREAGFNCINTDLIAGLPGETPDDMRRNMEVLAELSPENVTIHTLAIKRASRLNEIRIENKSDATRQPRGEGVPLGTGIAGADTTGVIADMLAIVEKSCAKMNLHPYYLYRQKNMAALYENIGYSLPNHECLYNVGMMAEVQTILGIGAGAVSKFVVGNKITREFNVKNPEIYLAREQTLSIE
ncbi:MAG: coproporphyrinogen dehydrogenase HemZ [Defluviitaleaceae bacterium]|nr:coproporphyrinogen dehydrogenase HemZ [Defluviitaleaceae bacterium]